MSKPTLVVGGGPAGLAAAQALASVGRDCILVDKAENCLPMIPSGKAHNDMILPDEIDDIGSVIDDKGKMLV